MRTERPLLQPGRNVWREATARASGLLVDAADYYHAFYWAAREARRSIVMSGWEFDRTVPLLRGNDVPDGAEVRFLNFMNGLCERNPDLQVCLLAWDFHVVLAIEREWMQRVFFHYMTNERLHFRVDDSPFAGGSHHQKFVVIDGRIAFLGGIDVCEARWDDRRHLAENPVRLVRGRTQKPYHDVQAYFGGGEVPRTLEQYFFQRWRRAGGTPPTLPPALTGGDDYAPRGAIPLGPARLALSRTQPHTHAPVIREVERLFTDAIAGADALIYIETQYFSSERICEALVQRVQQADRPRLEIVVVVNERAEAVKEEIAVGLRQAEVIEKLRAVAAATGHALGCYFTLPDGAADETRATYVHSKVMAVDDTFLTVGSANLTNRSMSFDSELHASWEARDGDVRLMRRIRRVRVSLLAEHSGASGVRAVRALAPIRDLVARLDAMTQRPGARLRRHGSPSPVQDAIRTVVDPKSLPFDPQSAA